MEKQFTPEEQESIRYEVAKGFAWHLDGYDLDAIIDDLSDLSEEERTWAKRNIVWNIAIEEREVDTE